MQFNFKAGNQEFPFTTPLNHNTHIQKNTTGVVFSTIATSLPDIMANKIELCFRTDPLPPEHASDNDQQQDTFGSAAEQDASRSETRTKNEERLGELYIGQRTVREVLRGLETVLGYELFPSQILQPGMFGPVP